MDKNTPGMKVLDAVPAGGSRGGGRPPLLEREVEKDLAVLRLRQANKVDIYWKKLIFIYIIF